jgi:hypothetical protein
MSIQNETPAPLGGITDNKGPAAMSQDPVKIRRALVTINDPREYLLTPPKGCEPTDWKADRIIRVPYGPIVCWVNCESVQDKCPACRGSGELEATGADGSCYDVECPKCDGEGEVENIKEADLPVYLWTDADGNHLDPVLMYPASELPRPTEAWVREWIQAQQAAR